MAIPVSICVLAPSGGDALLPTEIVLTNNISTRPTFSAQNAASVGLLRHSCAAPDDHARAVSHPHLRVASLLTRDNVHANVTDQLPLSSTDLRQ